MNSSIKPCLFLVGLTLMTEVCRAGRSEFDFRVGLPGRKQPVEVMVRHNPFQAGSQPDRPLPVLRDKDDPALKAPVLLAPHVRSIIRVPKPLLLLDGTVLQPGDEIRLGREPLLPRHRVVLVRIEGDRLVLHLTSFDPQQPGQVEAFLPLSPAMREN